MTKSKISQSRERSQTLTLHLIRSDITAYTAAIKMDADGNVPSSLDLDPNLPFKGRLFVTRTAPHAPSWKAFLDQGTTEPISGINVSSAGALLLLKAKGRMFGLTFGTGRFLLSDEAIEGTFGLKVALNSIDPDRLRSIDTASFEGVSRLRREQVSQASPLDNFGVEPAQDLLRSIVGKPLDEKFARRLVGTDALTMKCPLKFEGLGKKCAEAFDKSNETTYKERFPWVDNFRVVRGDKEYERLDGLVVAALNDRDIARIHLAPPDVVDWMELDKFYYSSDGGRDARHDELDLDEYLATRGDITRDHLRKDEVWAYDTDGQRTDVWPLYRTLVAEVADANGSYVLMQGSWYAIEKNYVKSVDQAVQAIPVASFAMPDCFKAEREEIYNKRVCDESRGILVLMDQKFIKYPGKSKLEACDIFNDKGCFIHVKKGTRSSNLSHLFLQGTVSASAFRRDSRFRDAMRDHLPKSHKALVPKDAPTPSAFSVCYAVGTKHPKKFPLNLPFFSRVSLMQNAGTLAMIGYPLSLTQIKMQN